MRLSDDLALQFEVNTQLSEDREADRAETVGRLDPQAPGQAIKHTALHGRPRSAAQHFADIVAVEQHRPVMPGGG